MGSYLRTAADDDGMADPVVHHELGIFQALGGSQQQALSHGGERVQVVLRQAVLLTDAQRAIGRAVHLQLLRRRQACVENIALVQRLPSSHVCRGAAVISCCPLNQTADSRPWMSLLQSIQEAIYVSWGRVFQCAHRAGRI